MNEWRKHPVGGSCAFTESSPESNHTKIAKLTSLGYSRIENWIWNPKLTWRVLPARRAINLSNPIQPSPRRIPFPRGVLVKESDAPSCRPADGWNRARSMSAMPQISATCEVQRRRPLAPRDCLPIMPHQMRAAEGRRSTKICGREPFPKSLHLEKAMKALLAFAHV